MQDEQEAQLKVIIFPSNFINIPETKRTKLKSDQQTHKRTKTKRIKIHRPIKNPKRRSNEAKKVVKFKKRLEG